MKSMGYAVGRRRSFGLHKAYQTSLSATFVCPEWMDMRWRVNYAAVGAQT